MLFELTMHVLCSWRGGVGGGGGEVGWGGGRWGEVGGGGGGVRWGGGEVGWGGDVGQGAAYSFQFIVRGPHESEELFHRIATNEKQQSGWPAAVLI